MNYIDQKSKVKKSPNKNAVFEAAIFWLAQKKGSKRRCNRGGRGRWRSRRGSRNGWRSATRSASLSSERCVTAYVCGTGSAVGLRHAGPTSVCLHVCCESTVDTCLKHCKGWPPCTCFHTTVKTFGPLQTYTTGGCHLLRVVCFITA